MCRLANSNNIEYNHHSDIVYRAEPGTIQIANLNQNYDPKSRGKCKIKSPFLKPKTREMEMKKTLVVDLDETLVHASFKPVARADIGKTNKVLMNLIWYF